MFNKLKLFLFVVSLILLHGCFSQNSRSDWMNVSIDKSNKADIDIFVESNNPYGTYFNLNKGEVCFPDGQDTDKALDNYFGVVHFLASDQGVKNKRSIEIPAREQISIAMDSFRATMSERTRRDRDIPMCQFTLSLIPENGAKYLIGYKWDYQPNHNNGCLINLFKYKQNGDLEVVKEADIYESDLSCKKIN